MNKKVPPAFEKQTDLFYVTEMFDQNFSIFRFFNFFFISSFFHFIQSPFAPTFLNCQSISYSYGDFMKHYRILYVKILIQTSL